MKRIYLFLVLVTAVLTAKTQTQDSLQLFNEGQLGRIFSSQENLNIGGYGEVHYVQPVDGDVKNLGELDVQRLVMLFNYNFSKRVQFLTEIEFEHVKEVFVEQAYLQYKINNFVNFRGGLLLIPMGIINEYHEPPTFNGVQRPIIDNVIAPTTWREVGFGFTGNILPASLKYQAYAVNGFNGYDGEGNLGGKSGLRGGRQKGAESFMSSPNFTGKVEYYGIRGLNIGLSGYFGKTQSALYDGIDKSNKTALATADSSVVGISMIGIDARYSIYGVELKGQCYYNALSNTEQYNRFTANAGGLNDLGKSMLGYYAEAGYNVFKLVPDTDLALVPFVRYEMANIHNSVETGFTENKAYNKNLITTGLTLELTEKAVIKADVEFLKSKADNKYSKTINAGVGVMF